MQSRVLVRQASAGCMDSGLPSRATGHVWQAMVHRLGRLLGGRVCHCGMGSRVGMKCMAGRRRGWAMYSAEQFLT